MNRPVLLSLEIAVKGSNLTLVFNFYLYALLIGEKCVFLQK